MFLISLLSGILGGMGMGGGTVLIPMLNFFCGVDQKTGQALNLIAFIPMSLAALYIHKKTGLLKTEGLSAIILPALVFACVGAFVVQRMDPNVLQKLFGAFLVLLSVFQIIGLKKEKSD